MSGPSGVELLVNALTALVLLVKDSGSSSELSRSLRIMQVGRLAPLVHDWKQLAEHREETAEPDGEGKDVVVFDDVRSSADYVAHYVSKHRDFVSTVIVVLWKSALPGPAICHDGMPLIYVHQKGVPDADFSEWGPIPPSPNLRVFTPTQIESVKNATQVIALHRNRLFEQHSNLVAIRCGESLDGTVVIEFVVLCKRFLPVADKKPLPRLLDDVPTRVRSGWIELCGKKEQVFHRPLLPGAGFAAGDQATLKLDVPLEDYVPPVLGTMGGCYVANAKHYGVTCAHCISEQRGEQTLLPRNTPVYQPSALGLLMGASTSAGMSGVWDGYNQLKAARNPQHAMQWVCDEVPTAFDLAVLPPEAHCGVVHGAVLGPIDNGEVVDVALIRLDEGVHMAQQCAPTRAHRDGQECPPLVLGQTDAATPILQVGDFPPQAFHIYGKGARSDEMMRALVNPLESEIYFREVRPNGMGDLSFRCVHAAVTSNWNPGDSGTWCWTKDGSLVGMGMAYAHIDHQHYCCILPMTHVVSAVEQLLRET
eukprot:gene18001-12905_t